MTLPLSPGALSLRLEERKEVACVEIASFAVEHCRRYMHWYVSTNSILVDTCIGFACLSAALLLALLLRLSSHSVASTSARGYLRGPFARHYGIGQ